MGIIASDKGGTTFDPIPQGVYMAVCYSVVDLGEQYSERFNNSARKILITWELPEETIEKNGEIRPRAISKEYTLSLVEKANLRKDLEAWRSKKFNQEELKGFDLENIINKGCQLSIVHDTRGANTYANVNSVMALPKGIHAPPAINPTVYFDLDNPEALNMMNKIPQWVQDKIKKSKTYEAIMIVEGGDGFMPLEDEDELPF